MPDSEEIQGTPVLRADASDDEEHRPEENDLGGTVTAGTAKKSQDGEDTLAQQPDLLDEVHQAEAGSQDDVRLVCPVCGLDDCTHNLRYIAAKED